MKKILFTLKRKWAEYLLEVLVIIGSILGAFALDNWSSQLSKQNTSIEVLRKVRQDLVSTKYDVEIDIQRHGDCLKAANRIYEFLQSDTPYYDSLDLFFEQNYYDYTIQVTTIGYLSMESFGFEVIQNKQLLSMLSLFYESHLSYLKRIDEDKFWDILWPYYSNNFTVGELLLSNRGTASDDKKWRSTSKPEPGGFRPIDVAFVQSDPKFKILMREVINGRMERIGIYKNRTLVLLETLIKVIDEEIEKL